jgi:hypothetical protein
MRLGRSDVHERIFPSASHDDGIPENGGDAEVALGMAVSRADGLENDRRAAYPQLLQLAHAMHVVAILRRSSLGGDDGIAVGNFRLAVARVGGGRFGFAQRYAGHDFRSLSWVRQRDEIFARLGLRESEKPKRVVSNDRGGRARRLHNDGREAVKLNAILHQGAGSRHGLIGGEREGDELARSAARAVARAVAREPSRGAVAAAARVEAAPTRVEAGPGPIRGAGRPARGVAWSYSRC